MELARPKSLPVTRASLQGLVPIVSPMQHLGRSRQPRPKERAAIVQNQSIRRFQPLRLLPLEVVQSAEARSLAALWRLPSQLRLLLG